MNSKKIEHFYTGYPIEHDWGQTGLVLEEFKIKTNLYIPYKFKLHIDI